MTSEVSDEDVALRRVRGFQFVHDKNKGGPRPSSAAFERREAESHASCYLRSLLAANRLDDLDVLDGHDSSFGLVGVPVAAFRAEGFDVAPDPDGVDPERPHKCDVAHARIEEPEGASQSNVMKRLGRIAKAPGVEVIRAPIPD